MTKNIKETNSLILRELSKSNTMLSGGFHRCSICNSVNNEFIETDLGDYKSNMSFTSDPKDSSQFICIDCDEAIEDVRRDFHYMDEWNEQE